MEVILLFLLSNSVFAAIYPVEIYSTTTNCDPGFSTVQLWKPRSCQPCTTVGANSGTISVNSGTFTFTIYLNTDCTNFYLQVSGALNQCLKSGSRSFIIRACEECDTCENCFNQCSDNQCGTLDNNCDVNLDCGGCGDSASCQSNSCVPSCTTQPETPAGITDTCATTDSGGSCSRDCTAGYDGGPVIYGCNSGSWSFTDGSCTEKSCTTQPPATTGIVDTCSTTSSGGTCSRDCIEGYDGGSVIYGCDKGTWSLTSGSCTGKPCTTEPPQTTGIGIDDNCGSTNSGSSCSRDCTAGYDGGPVIYGCDAEEWSLSSGSCTEKSCTDQPPATTGISDTCSTTSSGGSCSRDCTAGYDGTVIYGCDKGTWSLTSGSCTEKSCTDQPPATTGTTGTCSTTNSGSSCTLACAEGYDGGSVVYGCDKGTWSLPSGACTGKSCSIQPPETTGITDKCDIPTDSGEPCSRDCTEGYDGGPVIYGCDAGAWSLTSGSCTGKSCSITQPPQTTGITDNCASTNSGGSCSRDCTEGYEGGPVIYGCNAGAWSLTSGSCTEKRCTTQPPDTTGITTTCSTTNSGVSCSRNCAAGFAGGPVIYNCDKGTWSFTSGSCTAKPTTQKPTTRKPTTRKPTSTPKRTTPAPTSKPIPPRFVTYDQPFNNIRFGTISALSNVTITFQTTQHPIFSTPTVLNTIPYRGAPGRANQKIPITQINAKGIITFELKPALVNPFLIYALNWPAGSYHFTPNSWIILSQGTPVTGTIFVDNQNRKSLQVTTQFSGIISFPQQTRTITWEIDAKANTKTLKFTLAKKGK